MPVGADRGLTLVEVVVAAAVLACTVAVASLACLQAQRVRGTAARSSAAQARVANEVERLRALAFWRGEPGPSPQRPDLVASVFPHAVAARNTLSARYLEHGDGSAPEGSFVTVVAEADGTLVTRARFVVATPAGWRPLPAEAVGGFSAADAARPPAGALAVSVGYAAPGRDGPPLYVESTVIVARSCGGSRLDPPSAGAGGGQ